MKLFEVEGQLVALMERLMDAQAAGTAVPPEALAELETYTLAAAEKRDACREFLRFVDSREAELTADIDTATKQRAAIRNARERMEDYVLGVMQRNGISQANGNRYKFVVAEGHEHVETDEGATLMDGDSYQLLLTIKEASPLVRISVEPNKAEIAQRLKNGVMVYGASMKRGPESLQVKPLSTRDVPGETTRHNALEVANG